MGLAIRYDGSCQSINEALIDAVTLAVKSGLHPPKMCVLSTEQAAILWKYLGGEGQLDDLVLRTPFGPLRVLYDVAQHWDHTILCDKYGHGAYGARG